MKKLIIFAVVALLAVPVMAGPIISTTENFGTKTIPVLMDIIEWVDITADPIKVTDPDGDLTYDGFTTASVVCNFGDLDIDAVINPAGVGANIAQTYQCALDGHPYAATDHYNVPAPHLVGAPLLLQVWARLVNVNPAARLVGLDTLVANVVLTLSKTTP
jgi:hypothetical protein